MAIPPAQFAFRDLHTGTWIGVGLQEVREGTRLRAAATRDMKARALALTALDLAQKRYFEESPEADPSRPRVWDAVKTLNEWAA